MTQHMPLYDVPRETVIHIVPPAKANEGSTWFTFHRVDGMYSECTLEGGGPLHLQAGTMICYDGGRYWIE